MAFPKKNATPVAQLEVKPMEFDGTDSKSIKTLLSYREQLKSNGIAPAGRSICPLPEGEHAVNLTGVMKVVPYPKANPTNYVNLVEVEIDGKKFDALCNDTFVPTESEVVIRVDAQRRAAIVETANIAVTTED